MTAKKTKKPAKAFFIIPLLGACIGVLLYFFPYFTILEEGLYNLYFRLRPQSKQNEQILLLNVDDAAIRNVGTWPWPRGYMADGLLVLKEFNAGQIIFDIEYVGHPLKTAFHFVLFKWQFLEGACTRRAIFAKRA